MVEAAQPYQRLTCSGLVHASNTSCRGALNTRVKTISRSDGSSSASTLSLVLASTLFLLGLQGLQIGVQAVQALFPEAAIAFQPVVDAPECARLDPAGPPLRLATARDEAGALEDLQMLGDGGRADVEGLREFRYRRLTEREPRQDGAARGIGERRKRSAESVERRRSGHVIYPAV